MKPSFKLIGAMLLFTLVGRTLLRISLMNTLLSTAWGMLFAALLAGAAALIGRSSCSKAAVKKALPALIAGGALTAIAVVLYHQAAALVSGSVVSAWFVTLVPLLLVAGLLFCRERPPAARLFCLLAVVAGGILLSGASFSDVSSLWGVLLSVAAALVVTIVVVVNKQCLRLPSADALALQLLIGAVILLPYALWKTSASPAVFLTSDLLRFLLVGALFTAAATLALNAIKKMSLTATASFVLAPSALVLLIAGFSSDQTIDAFRLIGAILILGAFLISTVFVKSKE